MLPMNGVSVYHTVLLRGLFGSDFNLVVWQISYRLPNQMYAIYTSAWASFHTVPKSINL